MKMSKRALGLRFYKVSALLLILAIVGLLSLHSCGTDAKRRENPVPLQRVRIAGLVLQWTPGDREANMNRFEKLVREAASGGAKIVCTPESFLDGYSIRLPEMSPQEFKSIAEPIPEGRFFVRICRLSDELNIFIIAGLTEAESDTVYNAAALIGPDGKLLGVYRKNFLWSTETDRYIAGRGFPAFVTEYGRVGMMICSDRRETGAIDQLVKNGADIVFCPAGGGFGDASDAIVCQRAREGHVPIVFVHPVEFLVAGADGQVLARSVLDQEFDCQPDDSIVGEVRYYDVTVPSHQDSIIHK